jgi:aspartate/methionine/tyrosine aminotransferase
MTYAANRLKYLQESVIRSITRYAIEKGAVLLAQGFPDFDPPAEVIAAAEEAMRRGCNQYGMTWGQPSLRKAIADKSRRFYGQSVDPERHVTVTCGVTEAVIASLVAIVNPGERVIVLEPAHENYHAGIAFAGGTPVWVPIRPPDYRFRPDELRAAFQGGAKAIIFNSPHNPSGRVFTREELSIIADLCVEFDTVAITDEIYEHLVYDGRRHIPMATLPGMWGRTITICGMGKTFAVTGWRLGYAIANEELTDALRKVHDFTTVCAPTPLQAAMVAALNMPDSYYDWLRAFYDSRRGRMMKILSDHGFECHTPEGAYYTMASFRHLSRDEDDTAFAYWLIDEIGVATVPGSSFYTSDPSLGRGLVRFAFPKKDQTLDLVEERFAKLRILAWASPKNAKQ